LKYFLSLISLFLLSLTLTPGAKAEPLAISATDRTNYNQTIQTALNSTTLLNIAPPTTDIPIKFPNTDPTQPPLTAILQKGASWANLPIGAVLGMGNGQQSGVQQTNPATYTTIAAQVLPDAMAVTTALQGSLSNFEFLGSVPIKNLVTAFPELANIPVASNQIGSWSSCGVDGLPNFGQIAASACGIAPIPSDVLQAIPIQQTGLQDIPYADLAKKLNINNLPASAFPLIQNLPLAKIIAPNINFQINGVNLFKVDYLDTKLPGQGGNPILGINSISGSNRVQNSTCKDETCDYAVLRSFLLGTSADTANPYNNALSFQINSPGTTWLDGGIGTIGRTFWNFKEPPGVSPPFSADYMKIVLANADPQAGTVQQEMYFGFCMSIFFEWNCSSKFIGPIPLPWVPVSEANAAMLMPLAISVPTSVIAPPNIVAVVPSSVRSSVVPAIAADPPSANSTSPKMRQTYANLFGTNTLKSYSPAQNLANSNS
jgi:hypothetical protein